MSTSEIISKGELQHVQDEFCRVTGVCGYCTDGSERLTEFSGTDREAELARVYEERHLPDILLERVEEGSLEDQAVEVLDAGAGFAAAVAVQANPETRLCWVVYALEENGREEIRFLQTLDLLRDISDMIIHSLASRFNAEAESRRSRWAEQEMSRTLHTIEHTTEVVQLLDSDDRIESVVEKWLSILANHLDVDTALVFQLHSDGNTMDILSQWTAPGQVPYFDRNCNQEIYNWLHTNKPLVYSANTMEGEFQREIREKVGVKAIMVFPVIRQEDGESMVLSLNHRHKDYVWSMQEIKFTADAVKVLQSILTKRIQKNSLASSYEALEAILDNVGCSIYVTDKATGNCLFANQKLKNTFAKELRENTFGNLLNCGTTPGHENGVFEIHYLERARWYDMIYKEISWVNGKSAVLYSLYDTTDKKLYQRKIEQQAYTDFLTGLYNRMCCERDLARHIDQAKKLGDTGALLYIDLDDFKHINDGLGHQYGDVLLKAISHALQRIKGIENTCYRMGGDEFVVVVPSEHYYRMDEILEDIKEIFAKPWFLKDADYYCTMSMGIVTFPDLGESVPDLIKKADIAMYEAKKSGKNRVARYNAGINSSSGRRLDMEKSMRDATVGNYDEFEVYFQPIIDVQDETKCAGAEALIRWNSMKLGFIPPAEFIPLAEYLGLINPIGNYVLKKACFKCKKWNDAGFDYKVNVNLSVVQLLQPDVVEIVDSTLKESGLAPEKLTLEVTESLAINDMERMKEILGKIKSLGVKIALDDFGTGYSSLNHIREIPFDVIKVDQSFVKDLAEDAYSQSFVKMVAELAETLGVSICVEGIETEPQYKVVKNMKVKYIQGYYFDRPMKCDDFEQKYLQ
ncbi:MAG: EAL domain-containing protein [Acetatifactor sp.]